MNWNLGLKLFGYKTTVLELFVQLVLVLVGIVIIVSVFTHLESGVIGGPIPLENMVVILVICIVLVGIRLYFFED